MKAIVATAVGTLVLLTAPALAASRAQYREPVYQSRVPHHDARAQFYDERGMAYGAVIPGNPNGVVVESNKVLGWDPDPNVRMQLRQQHDVSEY
jgi:hypothetical protein